MADEMKWNTVPPIAPGWYWYRKFRSFEPTIVRITEDARCGLMQDGFNVKYSSHDGRSQWSDRAIELPREI